MILRRIFIAVLSLGASAVLAYLAYTLWQTPHKGKLSGIDIVIEDQEDTPHFMTPEDVLSELKRLKLDYTDAPLDSIDVGYVQAKLRELPLIDNAEVYLTARSGRMKVIVQQARPFFLVQASDSTYYVTQDRQIIPLNPNYAVYVPIASGHISQEVALGKLYDLISIISQDEYFKHYFGHYYVDEQQGLILTPRIGTARIILGQSSEWSKMLAKLRIFNQEVVSKRGWNAFEYIKLAFGNQVVAKEKAS